MNRLWLSCLLLLSLLVTTLGSAWYMEGLTDSLTDGLEQAEVLARRGAWVQADRVTRQCLDSWQEHEEYLHIVSHHADTDQILTCFLAVLEYLKLEEMDRYAAENRQLIVRLELLSEMEQPDILNVL